MVTVFQGNWEMGFSSCSVVPTIHDELKKTVLPIRSSRQTMNTPILSFIARDINLLRADGKLTREGEDDGGTWIVIG